MRGGALVSFSLINHVDKKCLFPQAWLGGLCSSRHLCPLGIKTCLQCPPCQLSHGNIEKGTHWCTCVPVRCKEPRVGQLPAHLLSAKICSKPPCSMQIATLLGPACHIWDNALSSC